MGVSSSRWISAISSRIRGCSTAWLANLVVIAGVPLFFAGVHLDAERERRQDVEDMQREMAERSIGYGLLLHSQDYADAQSALISPWIERREEISQIRSTDRMGSAPELLRDFYRDVIVADGELILGLIRIEGLLGTLGHCIDEGLCDESVARVVVGSDARQIHCFYGPHFAAVQSGMSLRGFGRAIERFAGPGNHCAALAASEP